MALAGALGLGVLATLAALSPPAAASTRKPEPSDFSCALPKLPHGVAGSPTELSGPAVTALTGGAARHGFSLDAGGLEVMPPQRGDRPLLSAHQATCGAMASTGGLSAAVAQGVAVGYGRVSVAAKFFPAITGIPSAGEVAARYPSVASFHDRLAWVVVVHTYPVAFNCPEESTPVHLVRRPSDHDYGVFLIDARTGAEALVYREGGPGGCTSGARVGPTVAVAEESVSVPWTLVSRDPDRYSGTIAATVLPCDQVPNTVLVDRDGSGVEVEVTRPFGPPCGQPESVPVSLHAAVVTADLPTVISHDPVGLLTNLSPGVATPVGGSVTTTPMPALVPVNVTSNHQTIDLTVGQVLTLPPLPGALGTSTINPAVSSDPVVLGPLTSGPQPLVAEFRAWKSGTADVTVPQSACVHPGSEQLPCTASFVVHVVVR